MVRLTAVLGLLFAAVVCGSNAARQYKMVCYYSSWATYRNGYGQFTSDDIDAGACTHLVYAFAGLDSDNTIRVLDPWLSLSDGKDDFNKFIDLRRRNPSLKLLIGVGGWNEGSQKYSRMVATAANRKAFVDSVLDFCRVYDFDGLNLDWQYPANRGGLANDKRNFPILLEELRQAFAPNKYVLGISAAGNLQIINDGYDVPLITKSVDYVSLLSYDYHGSWELKTGMNAPLYARKTASANDKSLTVDASVQLWLKKGADASKILLGLPTYGRTFVLREPRRNRVGDPSFRPGNPGRFTQQDGFLGYNEIIEMFEERDGFVVEFDDDSKVPFAYNNELWISYDNERSFGIKAEYIKQLGLGGAMVWSLDTDDFQGMSGRRNPLINTLREVLEDGKVVPTSNPVTGPPPTRPPHVTTPKPRLECKKAGVIPHPDDCTKFVTCIVSSSGGFTPVTNSCPPGLAFDRTSNSCNWPDAVPDCQI